MNPALNTNEHAHTDKCGFDRNASISEDNYVCMCGWRAMDEDDAPCQYCGLRCGDACAEIGL